MNIQLGQFASLLMICPVTFIAVTQFLSFKAKGFFSTSHIYINTQLDPFALNLMSYTPCSPTVHCLPDGNVAVIEQQKMNDQ